jgi:hypothetical protein
MVRSRTLYAGDFHGLASNFVVGGLDPVGSVGARAELFVFKGSAGEWIDDARWVVHSIGRAAANPYIGESQAQPSVTRIEA